MIHIDIAGGYWSLNEVDGLIEGARIVVNVCAAVKPGGRVLIVTDNGIDVGVAQVLMEAAMEAGADASISLIERRARSGDEPPPQVAATMISSDVVIAPTTTTLFYTRARADACMGGVRFLSMTGAALGLLRSPALKADFRGIAPTAERLANLVTAADSIRVTTPAGTDIRADIKGRRGIPFTGICDKPGMASAVPDIEVCVAPVENSAEGFVVVDGSVVGLGLVEESIRILVKRGRAKKIAGGSFASEIRMMLEDAGDSARVVAEFGIGLNPKAQVTGSIIEDEGVLGTVHLALGDNRYIGGRNHANLHIDMVIHDPTVELDGEAVLKRRQILF